MLHYSKSIYIFFIIEILKREREIFIFAFKQLQVETLTFELYPCAEVKAYVSFLLKAFTV